MRQYRFPTFALGIFLLTGFSVPAFSQEGYSASSEIEQEAASEVLQDLQAASAASQYAAEEARKQVAEENAKQQEAMATGLEDDEDDTDYYYTYDKSRDGDFYGVELPKRLFNNICPHSR